MTPRSAPHSMKALAKSVESQLQTIERNGGDGDVDLGRGARLHVSSLNKVYFPEIGATKGTLMRYYTRISPKLLPHLADRALILKRYPDGIDGPMFFQQSASTSVPEAVRVETLGTEEEGRKPRFIGGDLATLLYTVQLGAIEVHAWMSRVTSIQSPDRCLIDLDPGDDVPFSTVVSLAREVLEITERCGLTAAAKTSGSSGMHLVLPLPPRTTYEQSARLATLIAQAVVLQRADVATVERSIKARPRGSIYVDAMQNARGKSMATAYSVRATGIASVSAPVQRKELTARLRIASFTMKAVQARVMRSGDLWGDALAATPTTRDLARALAALEEVVEDAEETRRAAPRSTRSRAGGSSGGAPAGRRGSRR